MPDRPCPSEGENEQDRDERLQQEELTKAYALFEKHPELPSVLVEIHDSRQELDRGMSDQAKERLSEARLEHCLKQLEIFGRAYLRLVADFEYAKAYNAILNKCLREVWEFFAGFPIETIFATPLFSSASPPAACLQRDQMVERTIHWQTEGFRRVAELRKERPRQPPEPTPKTQRKIAEPRPDLLANLDITLSRLKAAEALGISPRTLDRWVADQRLTPIGTGHRKRFKAKDLKRLIEQRNLDNRDI
jgi:excisionase family DNA binding protein